MEKMRELKRRVRTDSGLIKTVLNVFQRRYLMKTTMKSQACCYLEGKVNNFGISESLSLLSSSCFIIASYWLGNRL